MPSDTYNSGNNKNTNNDNDSFGIEDLFNDPKIAVLNFSPDNRETQPTSIEEKEAPASVAQSTKAQSYESRSNDSQSINQSVTSNVINLFTQRTIETSQLSRIIRVHPESSGYRMLYSNIENPARLIAVPILCWALKANGVIAGMVPWLDDVLDCQSIEFNFRVKWEGFYCPATEDIFFEAPAEAAAMLKASARFTKTEIATPSVNSYTVVNIDVDSQTTNSESTRNDNYIVLQEIADPIGTHAMLIDSSSDSLVLTSIISWVLTDTGELRAMLANEEKIEKLPILPGDQCLYDAQHDPLFKCYFQRDIAEQIREQNPETMEAIERLFINE